MVRTASFLPNTPSAPSRTMRPADVNWVCITGIVMTYEATDDELIASGLVRPSEVPGPKKGCNRTTGPLQAVRLQDGRLRIRLDADFAAGRTVGFKQFLGGLLSDSRLSLVRGEVRT